MQQAKIYLRFLVVIFSLLACFTGVNAKETDKHAPGPRDFYSIKIFCRGGVSKSGLHYAWKQVDGYRAGQQEEGALVLPSYFREKAYYVPAKMFNMVKSYCMEEQAKYFPNVAIMGSNIHGYVKDPPPWPVKASNYWGPETMFGVITTAYFEKYGGHYIIPSFYYPPVESDTGFVDFGTRKLMDEDGLLRDFQSDDWDGIDRPEQFEEIMNRNFARMVSKEYDVLFVPTGGSKTLKMPTGEIVMRYPPPNKGAEELFDDFTSQKKGENYFKEKREKVAKEVMVERTFNAVVATKVIDLEKPTTFKLK